MTDWDKNSAGDSLRDSIRDSIHRDITNPIDAKRCGNYHGLIWGAVICAIGVLLLLDHLGLVSVDHLWRFWPMAIIMLGATHLSQPGKRAWGTLLVLVGVLLQLDTLHIIHFHWADLWPLVIIAVGLMKIWNAMEYRRFREASGGPDAGSVGMNAVAIFAGIERRVGGRGFRRGSISAIFGGAEIDFRDADIDGPEAFLEINTCCGGAEIRVPQTWRVDYRGQSIFGGYSDKTSVTVTGDPNATPTKLLIITGTNLFGGVEVKN
jgi:Domain of unknown function (DUF5668)/Cell wall-active antibiotics response 4TMS YvqF